MTSHELSFRRVIGWWLGFVLLSPLLWLQGRWARWRTPRLPEAEGQREGYVAGAAPVITLVMLGESPVAGVGVSTQTEALTAQLAQQLAARSGRAVQWHAVGENGIHLEALCERLLPRVRVLVPDVLVVAMGVNDTTGLTSRSRWRGGLAQLIAAVRAHNACPIVFAAVPPVESFVALPQPLRTVMARRARQLNDELREVAAAVSGVLHTPTLPLLESRHLSRDGYHPSAEACREWGGQLAECMLAHAVVQRAVPGLSRI